ncbi:unnamed protein product [Trichobilharzia szidati]|nr:unnamed protein product [Trichobilharzia szidati]
MIPFTDTRGDYTRVPPIYSPPHITTNSNQPTGSNVSETVPKSKVPSRRGRRSNVPPEIREQTRRLKKQNMERRRRACISDKMNALHNLAMNLIGINPDENHKVEKADILNLCHSVFEGIVNIVNDDPELKSRLKKLRNNLVESFTCPSMSSTKKNMPALSTDEPIQNSLKLKQENTSMNRHNDNLHYCQNSNLDRNQLFNAQSSPSSFNLSSCTDFCLRFDEENKENQRIQLYTENSLSFDKDCSSVAQSTSSTANPLLISPPPPSSSSFYSCSTPVNNTPMKSVMYSHGNSVFTAYHSTPLQSTGMIHSPLSNCDSGYHSSGYTTTTNSNMYNNESDVNITSFEASINELNAIQSSSGMLLTNPMKGMTSSSSPSKHHCCKSIHQHQPSKYRK